MTSPCDSTCDAALGVVNYFDVYRCEPEATYPIPATCDGDPLLEIRIAAAGGGEIGSAYANNDWIYGVWLGGALVCSGADLHSAGIAHTHRQMAAVLAEWLAGCTPASLRGQSERLGQWSDDEYHREQQAGGSDA